MNELTASDVRSSAGGSGASGLADAAQSAPARTKLNAVPLGAQYGVWYVPLASFVSPKASGRTAYRSVSLPRMTSSRLDQLASPEGIVDSVFPSLRATTFPSAVE